MRTFVAALVSALLVTLALPSADALAKKRKQVDYLQLASVLFRDGNVDRAEVALSQVDTSDEDTDLPRFYLLRGAIRLNQQLFSQSVEDLEKSIELFAARAEEDEKAEEAPPSIYVYLGQARYYSNDYEGALKAMKQAGPAAEAIRSTYALRSEALRKLDRDDEAWAVLVEGREKYPDYHELTRRQVFLAIELKLYRVATELGTKYLEDSDAGYEDYLALGDAMRASGNVERAIAFLELARLKNPEQPLIGVALARAYASHEQPRAAAALMERVALRGVEDAFIEAAELYRQLGEHFHAMSLNRHIADSKVRLRQRLGILIDMQDYELVAAMGKDLRRAGLLSDEPVRYALAYAYFETGSFAEAEELLSTLTQPDLFRKAAELRQAMARCEREPWTC